MSVSEEQKGKEKMEEVEEERNQEEEDDENDRVIHPDPPPSYIAHNSVQDVLRPRNVPAAPAIEKDELPKRRAVLQQNIVQEIQAPPADSARGREPCDNRHHFSIRFTPKPLS